MILLALLLAAAPPRTVILEPGQGAVCRTTMVVSKDGTVAVCYDPPQAESQPPRAAQPPKRKP